MSSEVNLSRTLVLSQESKVKSIEWDLGTQYSSSHRYVRFGFIEIPESVKTGMEFLVHKITMPLVGRAVPAEIPSTLPIPESANLFACAQELEEARAERDRFVSSVDAAHISERISMDLNVPVEVRKTLNFVPHRTVARKASNLLATALVRSIGFSPEVESSILQEVTCSSSQPKELTEDEKYIITGIEIRAIEVFTRVVKLLNQEGFLSDFDRKAILEQPLIQEIEDLVAAQRSLTHTLSPVQIQVMKAFFASHVTEVIEACVSLDTPEKLLGHVTRWETFKGPLVSRDIAFAALVHCAAQGYTTLLGEQFGGLIHLHEPAKMLSLVYAGETKLEGLLKHQGIEVPNLELQRRVLFECFEEQLTERFGSEDLLQIPAEFNPQLVLEMRRRLFVDGYRLDLIEYKDMRGVPMVEGIDESGYRTLGYAYKLPMTINTFSGTINALQKNFRPYCWHKIDTQEYVEEEVAVQRIERMREEVESALNPSEPFSSSR